MMYVQEMKDTGVAQPSARLEAPDVTTHAPNVIPRRDASVPPREYPVTRMFALRNIRVRLL